MVRKLRQDYDLEKVIKEGHPDPQYMKIYALKHKKWGLLGFDVTPNHPEDESVVPVSFELSHCEPPLVTTEVWTTTSKELAEEVAKESSKWYNADFLSPENPYIDDEIEVVEFRARIYHDN